MLVQRAPNLENVISRGFADDLQFECSSVEALLAILECIDLYCFASGGALNTSKTMILATRPWDDPTQVFDPGGNIVMSGESHGD